MLVQVARRSRSWAVPVAAFVIISTLGWLAWPEHTAQVVVVPFPVPAPPAPTIVVQAPPPPAPPPPAPPPAAPAAPAKPDDAVAPAVIGRTCPKDVTAIGFPHHAIDRGSDVPLVDGAASQTGCTIAAWSSDTIYVSWDGGQTFATVAAAGIEHIAVADGRVMAIRHDHAVGTLTAEARWIWRAPPRPPTDDSITLVAAGRYTATFAMKSRHPEVNPFEQLDAVIAFSSDDGQRWSYLTLPVAGQASITLEPDGRLVLTDTVTTYPVQRPGKPEDYDLQPIIKVTRHATQLAHPAWRRFVPDGWTYEFVDDYNGDHFTTAHLSATWNGRTFGLLGAIPTHHDQPSLRGRFALIGRQLFQLAAGVVAGRGGEVTEDPSCTNTLVAEDAYGTPIVLSCGKLLRWSERGGWRVLR